MRGRTGKKDDLCGFRPGQSMTVGRLLFTVMGFNAGYNVKSRNTEFSFYSGMSIHGATGRYGPVEFKKLP